MTHRKAYRSELHLGPHDGAEITLYAVDVEGLAALPTYLWFANGDRVVDLAAAAEKTLAEALDDGPQDVYELSAPEPHPSSKRFRYTFVGTQYAMPEDDDGG